MTEEEELKLRAEIGEKLKEARGRRSGRSVAEAAGISETYLRQIENGYEEKRGHRIPVNPTPKVLRSIANVVDVDPMHILNLAGHPVDAGEDDPESEPDTAEIIERIQALLDALLAKVRSGDR